MSEQDTKYMQMALRLAKKGIGSVEPNPAVGCIIVKANQIIGKGWHKRFGQPHAEINALEDCKTLGVNPAGATMYVTLEPCCHQGKTGPCTKAIIDARLAKVIVATVDPSVHANGMGLEQLRNAGIEVQTGVCEIEAKLLNAPFFKFAITGECWITLKWAQSIDGKLAWAQPSDQLRWVSGEQSRKDVQNLRRRVGAILVGINTVIADDPLLTARPSGGNQPARGRGLAKGGPTRIVLDSFLRIPLNCKLLETATESPVLILADQEAIKQNPQTADKITQTGAELIGYPDMHGRSNLYFLFNELAKRSITQLLVEGGPTVITSFLKEQLVDEFHIYISPKLLGAQGSADITKPTAQLSTAVGLYCIDIKRFGDDVCLTGFSEKTLKKISIIKGLNDEKDRSLGSGVDTGNQAGE